MRRAERLFLCAWPDDEAVRRLRPLARWAGDQPGFRGVSQGLWHVTLVFLGELDRETREAVVCACGEATRGTEAIEESITGVAALPSVRRCRVLGAAFPEDGALAALCASLRDAVTAAGVDLRAGRHRAPRPHVTLARRGGRGRPGGVAVSTAPRVEAAMRVGAASLVRSTLTASGPEYETIRALPLGGCAGGLSGEK